MVGERSGWVVATLVAGLLWCGPALAQDGEGEEVDPSIRATELAEQAMARYAEGDVEGAIALYHEAMSYVRDPAFAFNLAQLYDSIDRHPEAYRFYGQFLDLYPGAEQADAVRSRREELSALLESDYARLVVTTQPAGAEITVEGPEMTVAYGPSPVDDYVAPGPITIVAEGLGYQPETTERIALAGVRLEVDFGDLRPVEEGGVSGRTVLGWSLIGVGAATAATGVFFWLESDSSQDEYEAERQRIGTDAGASLTLSTFEQLQSDAEDQALLGNLLVPIGVAAVAGGVVVLLLDSGTETPETDGADAGLFATPGGFGLRWSQAF
jgi:tetratricopeptide (TPR) repeat protein